MNRRGLFRLLGGAAASSVVVEASTKVEKKYEVCPQGWPYQDQSGAWWKIQWTGWKKMPELAIEVCQFTAIPIKAKDNMEIDGYRPFLYQSVPGGGGVFHPTDSFNLAITEEQYRYLDFNRFLAWDAKDYGKAEAWAAKKLSELILKASRINWHEMAPWLNGEYNCLPANLPSYILNQMLEAA